MVAELGAPRHPNSSKEKRYKHVKYFLSIVAVVAAVMAGCGGGSLSATTSATADECPQSPASPAVASYAGTNLHLRKHRRPVHGGLADRCGTLSSCSGWALNGTPGVSCQVAVCGSESSPGEQILFTVSVNCGR